MLGRVVTGARTLWWPLALWSGWTLPAVLVDSDAVGRRRTGRNLLLWGAPGVCVCFCLHAGRGLGVARAAAWGMGGMSFTSPFACFSAWTLPGTQATTRTRYGLSRLPVNTSL